MLSTAAHITHTHDSAQRRSVSRIALSVAIVMIVIWAIVAWSTLRPREIVADWHGWRQADTQTIALNLTRPNTSMLWPQIAWGGNGPGYVETEFQLYAGTVAQVMRVFGPSEWAGQLVSLIAIAAAAMFVFVHLSSTHQPLAAVIGLGAFLAARTSPHLATVVMPDALALLWYVAAWMCFSRYLTGDRVGFLVAYGILGALAMLNKPTSAHLGISSFVLLAIEGRSSRSKSSAGLRDPRLWMTWAGMLAVFGLYLTHAHGLYVDYGNTFGLLFGEDSKVPTLSRLLTDRHVWTNTARFGLTWGLGWVAVAALALLTLRRRVTSEHVALAVGNVAVTLIAMRYMSDGSGLHYWAPASLLAAILVAALADELLRHRFAYATLVALAACLVLQGQGNMALRRQNEREFATAPEEARVVSTGKALARLMAPALRDDRAVSDDVNDLNNLNNLIVVRSPRPTLHPYWHEAMNYHDPRIFYLTGARGFVISQDDEDMQRVERAASQGASWLADPLVERNPTLDRWLNEHATLATSDPDGGKVWRLQATSGLR